MQDYKNIQRYLDQLQQPNNSIYSFLNFQAEREHKIGMSFDEIRKEQDDKRKFKSKYRTLHNLEKAIVNTYVDRYTNKVVQKMGYRRAVWKPCALIMIGIMYILNILACYARPDFITGIVCLLSVFFLTENDNINRDTFRYLPLLLFVSLIYDAIYLFYI